MAYTLKEIDEHINYWKKLLDEEIQKVDPNEKLIAGYRAALKIWEDMYENQKREQES